VNLAPRAMMGVESHGMLLAGHGHDGTVCLLPATGIEEGQRLG
jgi:tRNA-binding EMAP/Myf-like protein